MTIQQLKAKIIEWIKTGVPKNIKSYNVRALFQDIAKKLPDVENFANNEMYAMTKNGDELKSKKINPVQYTYQELTESQQIQALDNLGMKTVFIEGNRYFFYKKPGNTGSVPQAGDIAILGWENDLVFRLMLEYINGNPELFSSWKNLDVYEYLNIPYYIKVVRSNMINFPKIHRGGTFCILITSIANTEQPNATVYLGGASGIPVGHRTLVIAMQDSPGGSYADVGHHFIIINQKKQTVIVRLDHFSDLEYPGNQDYIYLIEDTGNTYIWSVDDNDYTQIGAAVEGELIDSTTFKDINENIVTPNGGNIYIDITINPNTTYRWDGQSYVPINSSSTGGGDIDLSHLTNNVLTKKGLNGLEDSKIMETSKGVVINDVAKGKSFIGKSTSAEVSGVYTIDCADLSEHYILTLIGISSLAFSNMIADSESAVITASITGQFPLTILSWLKPMPNNDTYDGSLINELVFNIKRGGANPIGYYSLTNMV